MSQRAPRINTHPSATQAKRVSKEEYARRQKASRLAVGAVGLAVPIGFAIASVLAKTMPYDTVIAPANPTPRVLGEQIARADPIPQTSIATSTENQQTATPNVVTTPNVVDFDLDTGAAPGETSNPTSTVAALPLTEKQAQAFVDSLTRFSKQGKRFVATFDRSTGKVTVRTLDADLLSFLRGLAADNPGIVVEATEAVNAGDASNNTDNEVNFDPPATEVSPKTDQTSAL